MRKPIKQKNQLEPDHRYNSLKVSQLINYVMRCGHKERAQNIVYKALDITKEKTKSKEALAVFEEAVNNVGPNMEVRSRRVGGANYQVPREVSQKRRQALALRWIVASARNKKGAPMYQKLAEEIIAASNKEGEAFTKRENTHKMAEANKAFAHFAW
ncbi:MAG: 30S ribosomal protein S7 [Candidatus Campbellbacteria bacterium]|nr:30S ribosomal protein S7 [Candidatus Campbellbacteria bacterium]